MDVARLLSRRNERCRPPRSFRHLRKADRSWLGPGRRIYRGTGEVQAVSSPTLLESSQPGATLLPANFRRFGQFLEPPVAKAKTQIAPKVIQPSEQHCLKEIEPVRAAGPDRCQRPTFAETPSVSLIRGVVV